MSRIIYTIRTGKLNYIESLRLQTKISNQKHKLDAAKFNNILILTEHNPVYTIGIRSKDYTIKDEEQLKALGAEFHKTNRGGLITFHGPGQLVAYPILHLKQFQPSVRWYVRHIEKTVIDMCRECGITAKTTEDTGIWVDDRKICAIGLHASLYVTTHGLALNCNTDLKWFDHIVPCGIVGKSVTSLSRELGRDVSIEVATPMLLNSFKNNFDCQLCEIDFNDLDKLVS